METISPGQIYLADQRGLIETSTFRKNCTFNYADYSVEHRQPFGKLGVLNDEILAAGKTGQLQLKQNVFVVIIPVTGEVIFKDIVVGNEVQIDVGDVFVSYETAGSSFEITNPYEEDWINFLYIEIKADGEADNFLRKTFGFDFDKTTNELIKVVGKESIDTQKNLPFAVHIGLFDSRNDAVFTLEKSASLFAFVIAGAFEFQGRLLHERDGLALWELPEADLEALSNNAVILVVEMPGEFNLN